MEDKLFPLKVDLILDFLNELPDHQILSIDNDQKINIPVKVLFYDDLLGYFYFPKDIDKKNFMDSQVTFDLCQENYDPILTLYRTPDHLIEAINQHYGKETKKETRYEG